MRTTLAGLALAAIAAIGTVVLVAQPATAQPDDSVEPDLTQPDVTQPDEPTPGDRLPSDRSPDDRRAEREARLDQLVEEGKISPERAAEIKDRMAERAERVAERRRARQATLEDLAATLDLTGDELTSALRSGSSLADLAADAGIDPTVIIEQLIAEATTRIEAAVADGHLDQARADELLAALETRITARINGDRPERPAGFDRPDRAGHGPGLFRDHIEGHFGGERPGLFGGDHPGRFGTETPGD